MLGFDTPGLGGLAKASSASALVTRSESLESSLVGFFSSAEGSKSNFCLLSVSSENCSSVGKREDKSSPGRGFPPSSDAKGSLLSIIRKGEGLGLAEPWCETGFVGRPLRIGAISGIAGCISCVGGDSVAPTLEEASAGPAGNCTFFLPSDWLLPL